MVEQIGELRSRRKVLMQSRGRAAREELVSTNFRLERVFSRAEQLSNKMALDSTTQPFSSHQWQRTKTEIQRANGYKLQEAKKSDAPFTPAAPRTAEAHALDVSRALRVLDARTKVTKPKPGRQGVPSKDRQRAPEYRCDPTYSCDPRCAGVGDSAAKLAEKMRVTKVVAEHVQDATTRVLSVDHLLGLIRRRVLPEIDKSNDSMRQLHELVPGGIKAFAAIHNVGANPNYARSDAFIQCAMMQRVITAFALMVLVACICWSALCASQSCCFRDTHSFGKQVFNPLLQVLVLNTLHTNTGYTIMAYDLCACCPACIH